MAPLPLSQIPTLSDLYKSDKVQPSKDPIPSVAASASLNAKISLLRTSITSLATTSIVNAANESLLGGGGVDGAIHAAAGPSLLAECRTLNGCRTGSAKITSGHDLPSQYVIHAVGPVYARAKRHRNGLERELLGSCYTESLELAREKGGSVAFSCLSTGVYGYPSGEAAEVVCKVVRRWLEEKEEEAGLERVVFCCFERKDERAYEQWLPKYFPPTEDELSSKTEEEKQAQEEVEESAIIVPRGESDEPIPKKSKIESQETAKDDWEDVQKPGDSNLENSTEMSEEGEKVESVSLAESDGEKVEKPKEDLVKSAAGYELVDGDKETENKLGKDW